MRLALATFGLPNSKISSLSGEMEGKCATTKHFFKVMMPGFHEKMNLPPAFCKKLKQEKSEQEAILKSREGMWKINMCRNCEGLICFKHGWPQFVNHHCLNVGDFVLFEQIGEFHFNVSVFDPSCCEKEFVVKSEREHEEEATEAVNPRYSHPKSTRREPEKESVISYHSQNPFFVLTMKHFHARGQVTIPAEFVRSNNLVQKTSVTLRDPRGRAWPMNLSVQRIRQVRLRIARGWHDFYVSNDVKEGDDCVFDLNPRSLRSTTILFDVKIFPSTLDIDPLSSPFDVSIKEE